VNVDYTPQDDKGGAGTAIPFAWDIAANAKESKLVPSAIKAAGVQKWFKPREQLGSFEF
jgi:hypothetical protein